MLRKKSKMRISSNKLPSSRWRYHPQFWNVLFKYLAKMGYGRPASLKKQADIVLIFVGAETSLDYIRGQQEGGAKVVQRVDGIGGWDTADFVNDQGNRRILDVHSFADAIVYQSDFNRRVFERFFPPPKPEAKKYVIFNGADPDTFSPRGPKARVEGFEHLILASAIWREKRPWKGLDTAIKAFKTLGRKDTALGIIGEVPDNLRDRDPNILYMGYMNHRKMASYFRAADLLVYFPWFDWCPNAVVEALACGLPVVCSSCGGTAELIGKSGIVIPSVPEKNIDNFYIPSEVDYARAADAMDQVIENRSIYLHDRSDMHAPAAVEKYIRAFRDLLEGRRAASL